MTVELPRAGGLYAAGNVTYRGTEVGRIKSVDLVNGRVHAVMSLNSDIPIPSDLDAEVHSQSAIGEQFIALLPRNGTSRPLQDGDVIPMDRTTVPPDINGLLDATNRGLQAIPRDDLSTVLEESYQAFGGMGPDIARLVKGTTALAIDSRANLESITSVIDNSRARAGFPDADGGFDQGVGLEPGVHHRIATETTTRVCRDSSPRVHRRPMRPVRSWNGCSRPCRYCWRTSSASETSVWPINRPSNSYWSCCPRVSPACRAVP